MEAGSLPFGSEPAQGTIIMSVRQRIVSVFDRILDIFFYISTIVLGAVAAIVLADIILRTFFGRPVEGTIELTGYGLVYITFLGAAWLLRDEGHVIVDLVIHQVDPRTQRILHIIASMLGTIMCLILTWYSARATWYAFATGYRGVAELEMPLFPLLITIPIGIFLLSIQFMRRTYGFFKGKVLQTQY